MANANQEPIIWPTGTRLHPVTGALLATPKQLLYIYHAYLRAGLTDTSRLTTIANSFVHKDMQVEHWMDIYSTTASHWIDAIKRAEAEQARRKMRAKLDPERRDNE